MSYGNKPKSEIVIKPDTSFDYDKIVFSNDTLFVSPRLYVELYRGRNLSDEINILIKRFSDKGYDTVCFDIR